ncbi:hypothetical protein Syun_013722 [Stephania yunnanensis]|uniref:DYW domain-containing protein n=1 Tax=Stephania yunnanensis TaxID=152371 RepID=A0AAP0P7W3_9MAGN
MASMSAGALKALFTLLGLLSLGHLIFTIYKDGLPFRKELITPIDLEVVVIMAVMALPSAHLPSDSASPYVQVEVRNCKTMRDLMLFHARRIKTGRIRDPFVAAEILKFCALDERGDLQYARQVFNQIEQPNCFSWNTIMRACSDSEHQPLEAFVIFREMLQQEEVEPNRFTFPSVLKACAQMARIQEGKQVHGQIIKCGSGLDSDQFVLSNLVRLYMICGLTQDACRLFRKNAVKRAGSISEGTVVLWNVMVDGHIKNGDIIGGRRLFDEMPQRSLVSWNGMIAGYAQNGFFKEALEIFREMQLKGVNPNYVTLVSVLPAIARLGALELGKWVHAYAKKNKMEVDDVLGSALIDMYAKCGNIGKAVQLFHKLPQKNTITWSTIIGGLAMHGQAREALGYFSKMEQAGVKPSDVCYIGVLSACAHAGLVHEGRDYFNHMVKVSGLRPKLEHYGCMVDLLGRAGLLEEAEELILNMPIKPDDVIFKALLGACKMHGNVEIGKLVAESLMKLNPCDSGSYVALSNMYALLGNWDAVAKMRLMMKEIDIRKDPGCSWIEVDGMIHEFLVEDDLHPKAKEIHLMLEEMAEKLKLSGYNPDTNHVLLNIGEEEKESKLFYHSEKIAIAFGLVTTSHGTPLRIAKNLRICGDCHSSIKLISRIFNRKIVIRDRKRFHHFESGFCSCKDYW